MTFHLFEAACCGLRAAEQVLQDHGIPVPATSEVIAHEPSLACGCDTLFVRPVGSTNNTSAVTGSNFEVGVAQTEFDHLSCGVMSYAVSFEVHLTRCVTIDNPLEGDCRDSGSCESILACDPATPPPVMPADVCDRAPVPKSTETWWLLNERFVLETTLAQVWSDCLCQGWCRDGCGGDGGGCGYRVTWSSTEPYDGGGCGGSILTFDMVYP